MYEASIAALCHCDNSPSGLYPEGCPCEQTKETHEKIEMLLETRKFLMQKLKENGY
ncbi:MAG: hypothetical protein KDK96_11845 [Chlamydiia bacterium]|nr:hypothetical protein [Chlamydiia bacterium]